MVQRMDNFCHLAGSRREEIKFQIDFFIDSLPERYSLPIILYHIEAMRLEDSAAQLGLDVELFLDRLYKGKQLICRKLRQKGVELTPEYVSILISENASDYALQVDFISSTAKAVSAMSQGIPTEYDISDEVLELTQGVIKSLRRARMIKLVLWCALAVLLALICRHFLI